jgi:hypothetical protein
MALLHDATLTPTKRELMTAWLATRPWAEGFDPHKTVASYRFDDPAGEVGLEGALLVNDVGTVVHVPLSYRGAPLEGADAFLVGTSEHSVLGPRWVYDACGDPVWTTALATVIATGGGGAEQYFEVDGKRVTVEPRMNVQGSGDPDASAPVAGVIDDVRDDGPTTVTRCGDLELVVVRMVGTDIDVEQTLTGRWGDASGVLAGLRGA